MSLYGPGKGGVSAFLLRCCFGFYSDGLRFTAATTTATPTLRVTRGLDDRVLVDEPAPFTLGTFANVHLGVCNSAAGTTTATVWLDDVRIDLG